MGAVVVDCPAWMVPPVVGSERGVPKPKLKSVVARQLVGEGCESEAVGIEYRRSEPPLLAGGPRGRVIVFELLRVVERAMKKIRD
jgi:hypothetical protein